MKYLAVFDLDGTLLDSNHRVSKENLKAVNTLKTYGVEVTIASGRPLSLMYHYAKELDIKLPIVTCNGARVFDVVSNSELKSFALNRYHALELIGFLDSNDYDWMAYCGNKVISNDNPRYRDLKNEDMCIKDDIILIKEFNEVKKVDQFNKILIMEKNAEKIETFKEYSKNYNDMKFIQSQSSYFDVIPYETSKAVALEYICKLRGIKLENTFAFGDQLNDLEMLKEVGYPFTTSNSREEIKRVAKKVFASNDRDGVSEGITYIVENILKGENCD